MANVFKNVLVNGLTTASDVYTAPAGTNAIVIGFNINNVSVNDCIIDVEVDSISNLKDFPLPTKIPMSPLLGKLVVTAGQSINVASTETVDVIISMIEVS